MLPSHRNTFQFKQKFSKIRNFASMSQPHYQSDEESVDETQFVEELAPKLTPQEVEEEIAIAEARINVPPVLGFRNPKRWEKECTDFPHNAQQMLKDLELDGPVFLAELILKIAGETLAYFKQEKLIGLYNSMHHFCCWAPSN